MTLFPQVYNFCKVNCANSFGMINSWVVNNCGAFKFSCHTDYDILGICFSAVQIRVFVNVDGDGKLLRFGSSDWDFCGGGGFCGTLPSTQIPQPGPHSLVLSSNNVKTTDGRISNRGAGSVLRIRRLPFYAICCYCVWCALKQFALDYCQHSRTGAVVRNLRNHPLFLFHRPQSHRSFIASWGLYFSEQGKMQSLCAQLDFNNCFYSFSKLGLI